jgi:hypothetical protein
MAKAKNPGIKKAQCVLKAKRAGKSLTAARKICHVATKRKGKK